jgi:hypothetical protein
LQAERRQRTSFNIQLPLFRSDRPDLYLSMTLSEISGRAGGMAPAQEQINTCDMFAADSRGSQASDGTPSP